MLPSLIFQFPRRSLACLPHAAETSKRTSSHMVAKVKKKVADKHRKDKKMAKKDVTWKSSQSGVLAFRLVAYERHKSSTVADPP